MKSQCNSLFLISFPIFNSLQSASGCLWMKVADISVRFIIVLIMIIYLLFISIQWYVKNKCIIYASANNIFKVMIRFCIIINLFI